MPAETHVLVLDPERVRGRAHDLVATSEEFLQASWAAAASGADGADRPGRRVVPLAGRRPGARPWPPVWPGGASAPSASTPPPRTGSRSGTSPVASSRPTSTPTSGPSTAGVSASGPPRPTTATWSVPSPTSAPGSPRAGVRSRSTRATARPSGWSRCSASTTSPRGSPRTSPPPTDVPDGIAVVTCGTLLHGLVDEAQRLAVVTGDDIVGQRSSTKDMRKMPARRKKQIDPLELKAGDHVVHEQHGVGRYVEMKQRVVQGATREYLVLEYGSSKRGGPPDRLYVPTDQLDQVTRYVGGDMPSLDRLGGSDWAKRKGRAKKAVRQIAAELIKLYAARAATKGHKFGPDSPWQTRAGGRLPVRRDPGPAQHGRRGQARHGARDADGPAGLRRRRLRQDRDRRPGGVQGGPGGQAGRGPGAHHPARAAALLDLRRADVGLPRGDQGAEPLPDRQGGHRRPSPGWPTARSTS